MKKYCLIMAILFLFFCLTSCEKKGDFQRVKLEEYNLIEYPPLEPLIITWWKHPSDSRFGYTYKKFCRPEDLKTIMEELERISLEKRTPNKLDIPSDTKTIHRDKLLLYLSDRVQERFRIVEVNFDLEEFGQVFITPSYQKGSNKIYEILSSQEECENYWGYRPEKDPNYKQNMEKMRERMRENFKKARGADQNATKP